MICVHQRLDCRPKNAPLLVVVPMLVAQRPANSGAGIDLFRPPSCKAGSSVAAEGSANVRSPLFWEKRGYRQKVSAVDIAAYDGMPNLMNYVSDSIAAFPRRHPILFTIDTICGSS